MRRKSRKWRGKGKGRKRGKERGNKSGRKSGKVRVKRSWGCEQWRIS